MQTSGFDTPQPQAAGIGGVTYRALFFWLLGINILLRFLFLLSGQYDLVADEAYYWDWSRHPDWSYFSKGPLVAYLVFLSTNLGAHTDFFVRLPALIASTITLFFVWKLTLELFRSERTAFWAAIVFVCVPIFNAGSLLMTIDNPLYCAWTVALYCLWKATRPGAGWGYWIAAGVAFGIGIMAKAVIVFFIPSLFLFLFLHQGARYLLRKPQPYIAILIGLLFFAPQIYWNAMNNFTMFMDFVDKGSGGGPLINPKLILRFIGSQALIFSPFIFALVCLAVWAGFKEHRRTPSPEVAFIIAAFLPVLGFYTLLSFHTKVFPNWAVIGYLTPLIYGTHVWLRYMDSVAARPDPRKYIRLRRWSFAGLALGLVPSIFLFIMPVVYAIGPNPIVNIDPTNRLKGWKEIGHRMTELRDEYSAHGPLFLSAHRYQLVAQMAFYVEGQPEAYCLTRRPRGNQYYFINDFDKVIGQNSLFLIRTDRDRDMPEHAFETFEFVEDIIITRGSDVIDTYAVYFGRNFQGWDYGE